MRGDLPQAETLIFAPEKPGPSPTLAVRVSSEGTVRAGDGWNGTPPPSGALASAGRRAQSLSWHRGPPTGPDRLGPAGRHLSRGPSSLGMCHGLTIGEEASQLPRSVQWGCARPTSALRPPQPQPRTSILRLGMNSLQPRPFSLYFTSRPPLPPPPRGTPSSLSRGPASPVRLHPPTAPLLQPAPNDTISKLPGHPVLTPPSGLSFPGP